MKMRVRQLHKAFLLLGWMLAQISVSDSALAAEIRGVKFSDQAQVGAETLQLNGMGLRKIRKFGIPVKVYVAALYTTKKVTDSIALKSVAGPKLLVMEFLHSVVEKEKLVETYRESIQTACEANCDKVKGEPLKQFLALLTEMRKGQRMELEFWPDRLKVHARGRPEKQGVVADADFSAAMLAVFTGSKSPAPELRQALLGGPSED